MKKIAVAALAFVIEHVGWIGVQRKLQDRAVWYEASDPVEWLGKHLSVTTAGSGLWRSW